MDSWTALWRRDAMTLNCSSGTDRDVRVAVPTRIPRGTGAEAVIDKIFGEWF